MQQINVFCFPYAGANKYAYNPFIKAAPASLNFIPVDIPGRGTRFNEPLLTDIHKIAADVFTQIKPQLNSPFIFFGHSMGTIIAYLLLEKLRAEKLSMPLHVFLTGRGGPSVDDARHWHQLPSDEFWKKLQELGGSPKEIFEDERIMELFEPILRADFEAIEKFEFGTIQPFDIPVTVMTGDQEEATPEQAGSWQQITSQKITVKQLPGDHFFIFNHVETIVQEIADSVISDAMKPLS